MDNPLSVGLIIAWAVKAQMDESTAKRRYGRERDTVEIRYMTIDCFDW